MSRKFCVTIRGMKAQKLSILVLVALVVLLAGAGAEARLSSHYQPLAGYLIMLDPGHGGADPGAVGPTGLKESDTNLRVARYLRRLLEDDGAQVVMTREGDQTVSLSARVDKAREVKPDLFVSIHHNASLRKGAENKGEIYFNALDRGIPLQIADSMQDQLGQSNLASRTQLIPGGFYVLRNNPAPAVLTEAAYISVPESERVLRSGKGLTEEAQRFRQAIRRTFGTTGPLRLKIISAIPAKTVSPFLNLLVESNKDIGKLEVRMTGPGNSSFGFERLPAIGNMYSLFNLQPLPTGDYELTFICRGTDGSLSQRETLPLQVRLPVVETVLLPVAPFIPEGYTGDFPIRVLLKDSYGKVNRQSIPFSVEFGSDTLIATTRADGQGFFQIPLTGAERDQVKLKAVFETGQEQTLEIPVRRTDKAFVLGRVVSLPEKEGLEQVRIAYGRDRVTTTAPGGYFFCEYSKLFRNLRLQLQPPLGYATATVNIRVEGDNVVKPEISVSPVAPKVMGRHLAIIAGREYDDFLRPLVRGFMRGGGKVTRLTPNLNDEYSHAMPTAQANQIKDLDLLISFRKGTPGRIAVRHYYRSDKGKAFGSRLKRQWMQLTKGAKKAPALIVEGGGEYELSHSGAPAVVFALPTTEEVAAMVQFRTMLLDALKQMF